jgi:GNAT superfamily N-acetyltransferase
LVVAQAELKNTRAPSIHSAVRIEPVAGWRLARIFTDVPWSIYATDPNWVPPLKSEFRRNMNQKRNPFFRYADVQHFVAFSGQSPVGRIAATVYPEYNKKFGTKTGFFGFFESVFDGAVSGRLIRAAEQWVQQRGMTQISGPYNYCSSQEMGLLVDGFDTPPALFQTYNAAYYEQLLAEAGFSQTFTCNCFRFRRGDDQRDVPALVAAGDRIRQRYGLKVRRLDPRRFMEDMETIRRLFNESFSENDDVVAMPHDVFAFQLESVKRLVRPDLITIVEKDGEPVAFVLALPNLNEVLHHLNGRITPLDLLRLPRFLKSISSMVVPLIGALPKWQGMGIGRVLVAEILRTWMASTYEWVDTTWIHQNNPESLAIMRRANGRAVKRHAIFSRELGGASA